MDKMSNQESERFPLGRFIRRRVSKDDCGRNSGDSLMDSEEFVSDNSALLSLHPWIFKKEACQGQVNIGGDKSRGSIRSRGLQRFSMKPVNFMGNYITPFMKHVEREEFVISSPPNSPAWTFRPFAVTDGNKIISKSPFDSFGMQPLGGAHKEDDGVGLGGKRASIAIPTLPELRKSKRKSFELQHERVEASNEEKPRRVSQFKDGMLLFCVGISIGMISCLQLKRTEVDKLRELAKQSEGLVQDLQEELEMKDLLSVKELAYGMQQSQKLEQWNSKTEESSTLWQNHNMRFRCTSGDENDYTNLNIMGEKSESLSKIEAELKEELERLEQNMNAYSIEQRMSDLSELDADLLADVVHGELRADNLCREVSESKANSRNDTNGSSTAHTYNANYCVSPTELSLRLHQVIQTRLEERIKELERELLQTQRMLSNSDIGLFSSNQESPREVQMDSALVHPLCLKLSGDAIEAYDEACEEFMQVAGKEAASNSSADKSEWIDGYRSNSSGRSLPWENVLWSRDEEDGESDNFSDEEGKMLIQQLVEKQRQGSPAFINAHRMLLLMDERIKSAERVLDI